MIREQVRNDVAMTTLSLRMGRPAGPPLQAGGDVILAELRVAGRAIPLRSLDPRAVGLPRTFDAARKYVYEDPSFTLPSESLEGLGDLLARRTNPSAPIWLELASPSGNLVLVPWERLLALRAGVPIFRLPYSPVQTVANVQTLDVVLCASSPVAKEGIDLGRVISELIRSAFETLTAQQRITVHVFCDAAVVDEIIGQQHQLLATFPRHRIDIHDPRQTPPGLFDLPVFVPSDGSPLPETSAETPAADSPWLRWIAQTLGDIGVDGVHFIGHSYLSLGNGLLALAESPTRNSETRWARFISPGEIAQFLARVGAWYVGFSTPARNYSPMGLRLLADQVARLHVGPVLVHDATEIDALFGAALQLVVDPSAYEAYRAAWPQSQAWPTFYCDPTRTGSVEAMELANLVSYQLTERTLLGGPGGARILSGEPVPTWLAAAQRGLERSNAELLQTRTTEHSPTQKAAQAGVEAALKFITSIIDKNM